MRTRFACHDATLTERLFSIKPESGQSALVLGADAPYLDAIRSGESMLRAPSLLALLCLMSACASTQDQGYPALVPMESLLSDAPLSPSPAPALVARADALRARAAALRAVTVVDERDLSAQ